MSPGEKKSGAQPTVLRSAFLQALDDPRRGGAEALQFIADGAMAFDGAGRILALMPWMDFVAANPHWPSTHRLADGRGKLVIPGLIDAHLHFPQLLIMGAHGEQLLQWLERHVFPAEERFADEGFAAEVAELFWPALHRHGTTTAIVYSSVHSPATALLAEAAQRHGARGALGKVMMDRNVPASMAESTDRSLGESDELAHRIGAMPRLQYAFTPRFAPTCSPEMLSGIGRLLARHPTAYVQTHMSETEAEVAWVKELFPEARDYADVYDKYGLLTPRTLLGHGIWLSDRERKRIKETGAVIVHCPVSNQFLGSGSFNLGAAADAGITVALGSDIAGGNTLSMFRVMDAAAKVQLLRGYRVSPALNLYMATLGNARALGQGGEIGSLEAGKQADFVMLDLAASAELAWRAQGSGCAEDIAAALVHLGDERIVAQTWVAGRRVR